MIKALFVTTDTVDTLNHFSAWPASFGTAERITYAVHGLNNDWQVMEAIERVVPHVMFYIGANQGPGNPRHATLKQARTKCRTINLCSDAMDRPWHDVLRKYRTLECFDLQVSIDGARNAPVDLATLTPVNVPLFAGEEERDIRCGFSGTVGRWNERSELVNALETFGGLTVRRREEGDSYPGHVHFLKRCRMLLNSSYTGTMHAHHIKGRVLEAGWAGCCLLESEGSPIAEWFPEGCWLTYRNAKHASEIIAHTDDDMIAATAANLSHVVRERYTPEAIYGEMLSRVGLSNKIAA